MCVCRHPTHRSQTTHNAPPLHSSCHPPLTISGPKASTVGTSPCPSWRPRWRIQLRGLCMYATHSRSKLSCHAFTAAAHGQLDAAPPISSNFRTTSRWTHVDPPPCWSMCLLLIVCYPLDPTYRMMPLPCLILTYLSSKYPPAWPTRSQPKRAGSSAHGRWMDSCHPPGAGPYYSIHPCMLTRGHKLATFLTPSLLPPSLTDRDTYAAGDLPPVEVRQGRGVAGDGHWPRHHQLPLQVVPVRCQPDDTTLLVLRSKSDTQSAGPSDWGRTSWANGWDERFGSWCAALGYV